MASPFPFTSGQVLTAAQLNSIGEVTAFTPSWTNFTPGNATESWHYVQMNEWLFFAGATTLGSTSSVTGSFRFAIPVGSQVSDDIVIAGSGYLNQGGTYALSHMDVTSGNLRWLVSTAGGTNVSIGTISATSPWTWGTGDVIRGTGAVLIS